MTNEITKQEVYDFATVHGKEYARDLLILAGPDGFKGDLNEYKKLLNELE